MGLKDRFAESYAKSKTMSGPEKRANEIIFRFIYFIYNISSFFILSSVNFP